MDQSQITIESILTKLAKKVDPIIKKILTLNVDPKFQELVKYPISAGGKRLRPALAFLSCQLLGGKLKDVLYPAAALEILHNYTLIIDDMIDNSVLRRGKKTCWAEFGQSMAQCVGIDFAASIFLTTSKLIYHQQISALLVKTLKNITDGEILDILFEHQGHENEPYLAKHRPAKIALKDYFKMISLKTAVLFQTACQIGGICAQANQKQIRALRNFGFNFGMAFQIRDDILDIFGDQDKFKKEIGKDIKERKLGNLVILLALQELLKPDKERFFKIMEKKKIGNNEVKVVMDLIQKTRAREKSRKLGEKFISRAKQNLKSLPQNKINRLLENLADFVIKRDG